MLNEPRRKRTGRRYPMTGRPGSHVAYARGRDLVVEWYDFGDGALYEFAKLMVFDAPAQERIAAALEASDAAKSAALAAQIAAKFGSFFEVEKFVQENGIPFELERNFEP